MPTGVGSVQYPEQPPPPIALELDNSYFLVKLHDAQAFFDAGWLVKPGVITISSSVESSFQSKSPPAHSLYQVTALQKNVPCRLGLSFNLTDWLPARATDWLHITLDYTVVQDTPIKDLVDKMGKIGLAAKVSLVSADWAVAVKVSEIVARLLSHLLGEGSQHSLFSLKMDLNLANLKTGYYTLIGSQSDEDWPSSLRIDANGNLTDKGNHVLKRLSYAVIEVQGCSRRGSENARGQTWWEMLQMGKEIALFADASNARERSIALNNWRYTLGRVNQYANEEHGYLLKEIQDIIRTAHVEVSEHLLPETTQESFGDDELPDTWKEVLGVRTQQEILDSVRDYKDAVQLSQQVIRYYGVSGG